MPHIFRKLWVLPLLSTGRFRLKTGRAWSLGAHSIAPLPTIQLRDEKGSVVLQARSVNLVGAWYEHKGRRSLPTGKATQVVIGGWFQVGACYLPLTTTLGRRYNVEHQEAREFVWCMCCIYVCSSRFREGLVNINGPVVAPRSHTGLAHSSIESIMNSTANNPWVAVLSVRSWRDDKNQSEGPFRSFHGKNRCAEEMNPVMAPPRSFWRYVWSYPRLSLVALLVALVLYRMRPLFLSIL